VFFVFKLSILQLGENQSLKKADEWRRLLTVTPVVLWWAWKGPNGAIPDTEFPTTPNEKITTTHCRRPKALYDAILLLCAAVRLLSSKRITMAQARAGQTYFANYCQRLILLGVPLTISHHLAMHFAKMIKVFGPVYGWWLFAFERFNGMMKKVNHNGHDGGRMELTLLRNWVQTQLIYELLLALPPNASQHERDLLNKIIKTEAKQERGAMMTQIAVFQSEARLDSIALPKRLPKPINLHQVKFPILHQADLDIYSLLLGYCQRLWPDLDLRRELSLQPGVPFIGTKVARRLPYIRKDGLRYGSHINPRTKADTVAFIEWDGRRVPVRFEDFFAVQIPNSNKPSHVCAVVRRFQSEDGMPYFPWDLLYVTATDNINLRLTVLCSSSVLGIHVSYANVFHSLEIIPCSTIDCPLALIPVYLDTIRRDIWISVSFDHVLTLSIYKLHAMLMRFVYRVGASPTNPLKISTKRMMETLRRVVQIFHVVVTFYFHMPGRAGFRFPFLVPFPLLCRSFLCVTIIHNNGF
jgi:hypothetical protein